MNKQLAEQHIYLLGDEEAQSKIVLHALEAKDFNQEALTLFPMQTIKSPLKETLVFVKRRYIISALKLLEQKKRQPKRKMM